MKLSCAMIVRDCEDTLQACLESVRPYVDELVIVDTGSTDATTDIGRKYADRWELFLDCNNSDGIIDDFSLARNRSFDLATGDWVMWIDSDDILQGGEHIRGILEQPTEDNVAVMAPYDYAHDEHGRCTCVHLRERIVRPRHRFVWQSPIHEVLVPVEPIQGSIVTLKTELFRIVHRRQMRTKAGENGRNLRILKAHVAKTGERDVRALYYLGLEFGYAGDLGSAIRFLRRYTELSTWHDEKCLAMIELARLYGMIGDHESAIHWALQASIVRAWPETYWRLAKSFYALARAGTDVDYNFHRAAHFIQLGNTMGANDTVLFVDPLERYRVHEFLNVCLSTIGDLDGAIESCKAGLSGMPENEPLRVNLDIYTERQNLARAKDAVGKLKLSPEQRAFVERSLSGEFQVELTPPPLAMQPAQGLPHSTVEHRAAEPGKLDLVFLVGHQAEPWNPTTVDQRGIGGSETMAMHMARLLAAKGHAVRLYGQCTPSMEGVFDGVEYLDASRYQDVTCDIMISSRKPVAVDDQFRLNAKVRMLWVHDVHCGQELDFVRDLRFDRILCLSAWHKSFFERCYPRMNPDKVIQTRNGIDLRRFEGWETRDTRRVVYSSSPDRGLAALLDMWPEIRARVPDASLHVYYGFGNWEMFARMSDDQPGLRKLAHLRHLATTSPGVVFHDRVNQNELAREFMRSGVWAYPTWFHETSCITAMEAQAAGLNVVTSALAALNETVGEHGKLIDWGRPEYDHSTDPLPEYRAQFIEATVAALKDGAQPAAQARAFAEFSIETLADDWDKMLHEIFEDVSARVVPRFYDEEKAA